MSRTPTRTDRAAQLLAVLTAGSAVVMVLLDLAELPLGLAGERVARANSLVLSVLAMASALTAGMAALRPQRREFLWFGVLTALAGAFTLLTSGLPLGLQPPEGEIRRVWTALVCLVIAAGQAYAASLTRRPLGRDHRAVVGLCLGGAALGLALPPASAPWLAPAAQALAVLSCVSAGRLYVQGTRERSPGLGAFTLAVAALMLSVLLELLLDASWTQVLLTAAIVLFAVSVTMALFLRLAHAAEWSVEVVEQSRDAIVVLGRDGRVEVGNSAADALFERPARGLRFADHVLLDEPGGRPPPLDGSERGRHAELRLARGAGGDVHVEIVATALPEGRTLLVIRDVSSRRQLEASLMEAARRETAAIIAGGIAHDFNNAMGALLGNVEILRARADEATGRRLERMEALIRRATLMTRRIISAVRGGEPARRVLSPEDPVNSAVELCGTMMPAEIALRLEVAPDLPRVLGDADGLEQVVLNLVLNARDAMSASSLEGAILVRASRVASGPQAGWVSLSVEDDGPGVPPELLERIWEPFFTTKGAGRGTGLGLAVVARVAREHGGQVEVGRAQRGRGARFEVLLPPAEHTGTLTSGGVRVAARALVVEDDPDLREHMRAELAARGCEVRVAVDAEEAERLFEGSRTGLDLLVTDVVLPGGSGIALARRLHTARPGLAVLIVSGFIPQNEPALDPRWEKLEKPFSAEQFAVAVRRAMLRALRAQPGQP